MQELFFEGRTVKPHGDFVRAANLVFVLVTLYFRAAFSWDGRHGDPRLGRLWSISGRDLNPQLPGMYFQDAASYCVGVCPRADDIWASAPVTKKVCQTATAAVQQ